jgi:hypothetical protein
MPPHVVGATTRDRGLTVGSTVMEYTAYIAAIGPTSIVWRMPRKRQGSSGQCHRARDEPRTI